MSGAGVYILTGSVAKESTGPAVVVSFFIAAIVAMLAGENFPHAL